MSGWPEHARTVSLLAIHGFKGEPQSVGGWIRGLVAALSLSLSLGSLVRRHSHRSERRRYGLCRLSRQLRPSLEPGELGLQRRLVTAFEAGDANPYKTELSTRQQLAVQQHLSRPG